MLKIVVLSGAGISAESGISTFRASDGLWENHKIEDVATPEGWLKNPDLVLEFYNQRRKQLFEVEPNAGHLALVDLEQFFDVQIITQNVDDLHERAGSSKVLHLHGELKKARSSADTNLVYDLSHWELKKGDVCEKGSQLRPHIVWFGEDVPEIISAMEKVQDAHVLIVVGTSLNVYPAAGLINETKPHIPIYLVDPNDISITARNVTAIKNTATQGLPALVQRLKREYF